MIICENDGCMRECGPVGHKLLVHGLGEVLKCLFLYGRISLSSAVEVKASRTERLGLGLSDCQLGVWHVQSHLLESALTPFQSPSPMHINSRFQYRFDHPFPKQTSLFLSGQTS
jgi:hypothetical protein